MAKESKDKKVELEIDGNHTSVSESEAIPEQPKADVPRTFEELPADVKSEVTEFLEKSTILTINTSSTTHTLEDGTTFAPRTKLEISEKDFARLSPHGIRAL